MFGHQTIKAHRHSCRYLSSPIVPVIVDLSDSALTFHLHSRLLVKASSYFKAALRRDRFTEGQEQKVELEGVQPATFGFFIEWLYRERWLGERVRDVA